MSDPVKEPGRAAVRRARPRREISRALLIVRFRQRLERGYPRLRMLLLVAITGGTGFVVSYSLLQAGLAQMSARYFLSVVVSYLVFLGLLWLWLRGRPTEDTDLSDLPELLDVLPHPDAEFAGGAGDFGGGGASSSWSDSADAATLAEAPGHAGEAASSLFDADELVIPVAAVVALLALLLSSLWVVYSAPVLFAELLVDGILTATLYRRLRTIERRHWLATAIRRTSWPFLLTALLAATAGFVMETRVPGADSIGDVLRHSVADR